MSSNDDSTIGNENIEKRDHMKFVSIADYIMAKTFIIDDIISNLEKLIKGLRKIEWIMSSTCGQNYYNQHSMRYDNCRETLYMNLDLPYISYLCRNGHDNNLYYKNYTMIKDAIKNYKYSAINHSSGFLMKIFLNYLLEFIEDNSSKSFNELLNSIEHISAELEMFLKIESVSNVDKIYDLMMRDEIKSDLTFIKDEFHILRMKQDELISNIIFGIEKEVKSMLSLFNKIDILINRFVLVLKFALLPFIITLVASLFYFIYKFVKFDEHSFLEICNY